MLAQETEKQKEMLRRQFVVFQIGREEYGVDINQVKEIIKPTKITNVPNTDRYVMGVINLRGQIVPVVDLRKKIGVQAASKIENRRIITVELQDSLLGLMVDGVNEVFWLEEDDIEPAPETAGGLKQEFLLGVAEIDNHLLILIDLIKLLFDGDKEE